jgi:hypothetical protein
VPEVCFTMAPDLYLSLPDLLRIAIREAEPESCVQEAG